MKVKITINKETEKKLEKFGSMNSTFDSVLNDLLDHVDTCDRWWDKR